MTTKYSQRAPYAYIFADYSVYNGICPGCQARYCSASQHDGYAYIERCKKCAKVKKKVSKYRPTKRHFENLR